MIRPIVALALALVWAAPAYAQQGHVVNDNEPNDSRDAAQPVAMGDSVVGTIGGGDITDYYAIDLAANQQLHVGARAGARLSVDARNWDNTMAASFQTQYADELHSNLWLKSATAVRIYISIASAEPGGAVSYRLGVDDTPVPQGPGDPSHDFAHVPQGGAGMVAGNGMFWVVTETKILKVDGSGAVSTLTTTPPDQGLMNGAVALDGAGNLLVVTQGTIWRITPSGQRTEFARGGYNSRAIAVAPNGDVWVGSSASIRHFSEQGALIGTVKAFTTGFGQDCSDITYLAFSPAGELHYAAEPCSGLFKLTNDNTTPLQVMTFSPRVEGPAFDKDGYLYLVNGMYPANGNNSKIVLFDPQYHTSKDPFATDIWTDGNLQQLVFWRDESGNTTKRLFAIANGRIIELNSSGIRAAGWPVGKQGGGPTHELKVAGGTLRSATVGTSYTDTLKATDAPGAVTWSISSGTLPAGLALNSSSGVVSGTPTSDGTFTFDGRATSGSQTATGHFTIAVTHTTVTVAVADIARALMGGASLTAEQVQYLDGLGNHNGRLDVGDLRAYLRAQGQLANGQKP